MRKLFFLFFFLFFLNTFAYAEERYKIYEVDKLNFLGLDDKLIKLMLPLFETGQNKNQILLDTQTGHTWVLTFTTEKTKWDGEDRLMYRFFWNPVFLKNE